MLIRLLFKLFLFSVGIAELTTTSHYDNLIYVPDVPILITKTGFDSSDSDYLWGVEAKNLITFNGKHISFVEGVDTPQTFIDTNPSLATLDFETNFYRESGLSYFIAHQESEFKHITDLTEGDTVGIYDRDGLLQNFKVKNTRLIKLENAGGGGAPTLPRDSEYLNQILENDEGMRRVILQTCVEIGEDYFVIFIAELEM